MIKKNLNQLKFRKRFDYLKNIIFNEKDLKQKGTRFQVIKFLPGKGIKPHYHKKVCEIFCVKSGKGIFIINGKKYKAKENDVFLCQPGDVHSITNNSRSDLVMLIFKTNESGNNMVWI